MPSTQVPSAKIRVSQQNVVRGPRAESVGQGQQKRSPEPSFPDMLLVQRLRPSTSQRRDFAPQVVAELLEGGRALDASGLNLAKFDYQTTTKLAGLSNPFGPPTALMACAADRAEPVLAAQGEGLGLRYTAPSQRQTSSFCEWVPSPLWFNQGALDHPLLYAANGSSSAGTTADVVACNGTVVNAPLYLLALRFNALPAVTYTYERSDNYATFSFVPVPVNAQDVTCLAGNKTVVASYTLNFDPRFPPVLGHGAKGSLPFRNAAESTDPTTDGACTTAPPIVVSQFNATQLSSSMAAALGPRAAAPNALDVVQGAGLLFGSALVLLYLLPKGLRDTFSARQRRGAAESTPGE